MGKCKGKPQCDAPTRPPPPEQPKRKRWRRLRWTRAWSNSRPHPLRGDGEDDTTLEDCVPISNNASTSINPQWLCSNQKCTGTLKKRHTSVFVPVHPPRKPTTGEWLKVGRDSRPKEYYTVMQSAHEPLRAAARVSLPSMMAPTGNPAQRARAVSFHFHKVQPEM